LISLWAEVTTGATKLAAVVDAYLVRFFQEKIDLVWSFIRA